MSCHVMSDEVFEPEKTTEKNDNEKGKEKQAQNEKEKEKEKENKSNRKRKRRKKRKSGFSGIPGTSGTSGTPGTPGTHARKSTPEQNPLWEFGSFYFQNRILWRHASEMHMQWVGGYNIHESKNMNRCFQVGAESSVARFELCLGELCETDESTGSEPSGALNAFNFSSPFKNAYIEYRYKYRLYRRNETCIIREYTYKHIESFFLICQVIEKEC